MQVCNICAVLTSSLVRPRVYLSLAKCFRQRERFRRRAGQSLIETMAGFMVLIPIGLLSYDLTFILIANQNNERLADNAARAAANHGGSLTAQKAAEQTIDDFRQSSSYGTVTLANFNYDQHTGQISLITQMDVKLPVPLGSWSTMTINAQSLEPIMATPASR